MWQKTYPTVADIGIANFDTLAQWHEHLPAAQTDVERTVRRRLSARLEVLAREQAPEVMGKLDSIHEAFRKLGIPLPNDGKLFG